MSEDSESEGSQEEKPSLSEEPETGFKHCKPDETTDLDE